MAEQDIIKVLKLVSINECNKMESCRSCSAYIHAVMRDDFFNCYNVEKMKSEIIKLLNCL